MIQKLCATFNHLEVSFLLRVVQDVRAVTTNPCSVLPGIS
jgi:hypothetical protein